jgi:Alpha/beta hydrolase domain
MGAVGEGAAELDGVQGYVLGVGLGWVAGVRSAGWAGEFGEEWLAVAATRTSLGSRHRGRAHPRGQPHAGADPGGGGRHRGPLSLGLARQPDSDWLRLWETAGTAHADAGTLGAEQARSLGVDWRINEGPHRFIVQAALHALHRWVGEGTPPPRAARIELASQQPLVIARDQYGIALGGVRTPPVDVPVVTLSGQGPPGAAGSGWLVGSTTPLDDATLLRLYGDKSGYLSAYAHSLDAAIRTASCCPRTGLTFSPRQRPSPSQPPSGAKTDLGSAW